MGQVKSEGKVLGPFRATQIWNEIVMHLKLTVELKRRRHKMRYVDNCFTGTDAVNVILQYLLQDRSSFGGEISREKAVRLCQTLMDRSVFEPVSSRVSEAKRLVFEDSHSKLYQFMGIDPVQNLGYESDGEALDDSDDDTAGLGDEGRNNQDLEPDIIGSEEVLYNPILLTKQSNMISEVLQLQKGLKRKSLNVAGHSLQNSKCPPRFSRPGEIDPTAYDEMWREVALRKLLTLVDVPILDGLLCDEKPSRRSSRFNLVIANAVNCLPGLQSSFTGCDDPWVQSALELLEGLPLGFSILDGELQGPVSSAIKKEFFGVVTRYYHQSLEPLLPERFIDLYLAILNLILQERDEVAVQALQLLMILLPWHTVEEVQRLFHFMSATANDSGCVLEEQEENKIVVIKLFTDSLIQHPMISHNLAAIMVGFVLTNVETVFTIPKDIEDKVHYYMEQVKQGKLDPVIEESYCARLTEEEYSRQSEEATEQGLRDMIDSILDDTKIPLKEKKHRLKQFQKFHPKICAEYFPDIV